MKTASAQLRIDDKTSYGIVHGRLYGHFAEHIGRCCYGGLWAGHDSCVEVVDGFRKDVVEALIEMRVPLLRWPGGCFADHYHWKDGIGRQRPGTLGMSCGRLVEDDNSLGTHEFFVLCDRIGAEPYLAANVGSGTPQELKDWIEYCNCSLHTDLTRARQANGRSMPWGVRLWGVGNESWGCGGNLRAEEYAAEFRRFSTLASHVDSSIERVAVGFDADWNKKLMDDLADHLDLVDHLSVHRYWNSGGPGRSESEDDFYRLLVDADQTEAFVNETAAILAATLRGQKKIGIALDEWGVWHPEARNWGVGASNSYDGPYEQACTLRDALMAAVAFEGFHRCCDKLSMTNLAQIVNVLHAPLRVDGSSMWKTPTFHVLKAHARHIGGCALKVDTVGSPTLPSGKPSVTATATSHPGGTQMTIINRSFDREIEVAIPCDGPCGAELLSANRVSASNSPDQPQNVVPSSTEVRRDFGVASLTMPPHSVASIEIRRKSKAG